MENDLFIAALPEIKGVLLDVFLQSGWYRYGDKIFTTDSFEDRGKKYDVYWLRYDVARLNPEKSYQKLARTNKQFQVRILPFRMTEELHALHELYFFHITFITSFTIEELLTDVENKVFDSHMIEVRDGEKLIAAGIFDKGNQSIAGIKNFYHPDYKKYSLGKYLIWLKYRYCLQENIKWYYPGYFAPENKRFDYKLDFDKNATEVCEPLQRESWIPLNDFVIPESNYSTIREVDSDE